jgi:hypothetical protein
MDQKLEDIDPDARKKYDKDMKQQAKEALRRDALHLSNDDFGSKYGRDRTAKETAARSANETAGYKAAETDAKKEARLNAEYDKIRGDIKVNQALSKQKSKDLDARQDTLPGFRGESRDNPNRAEMERRAIADQDAKAAEREARKAAKSSGGGGGGGVPKTGLKKPLDMKKGGMVSSASKRADGIATKGKTKGRMV